MLNYAPSLRARAAAELELRRRNRQTPLFADWLPMVTPEYNWSWAHLNYIKYKLHKLIIGDIRKLAIFVPPRYGKTSLVTVRFPAWALEKTPTHNVIVTSYSQPLANRFSRLSRKITRSRIPLDRERKAVEEWYTREGGSFRAAGVGGGITGIGGDYIIIDDPIKSREEANSPAYRERVWDWYTDDLYTRLEPNGKIILIMTRWHEDDLAGRILLSPDAKNWDVVSLPALALEDDPLGREPGEPLCVERFTLEELQGIKTVLGNSFNALYQQRPQAPEGGMFKRAKFQFVTDVPRNVRRIRWWDYAATDGAGDFTVGCLMAVDDKKRFYVEDVVRGQWASDKRNDIIISTANLDAAAYNNTVTQWREQEPGSSGKDGALEFVKMLAGIPAKFKTSTGSKMTRADPFSAQVSASNVYLKRANWNPAFINELAAFPTSNTDDQVDAASSAFNRLARAGDSMGHTRVSSERLVGAR